jgi:hypothetical protein
MRLKHPKPKKRRDLLLHMIEQHHSNGLKDIALDFFDGELEDLISGHTRSLTDILPDFVDGELEDLISGHTRSLTSCQISSTSQTS